MLDFLISNPWLLALIWAAMYVFDYSSTLWLVHAYETTFSRYIHYEHGLELNPNLEKEIASRKRFSPKFMLLLSLVVAIILLSPLVGRLFTEFLAGATLLTWSFVNIRHLRNYAYVWFMKRKPDAIGGQQTQSYWYMQKMLSADAFTFGLLYLFLALLTLRIFFFAGAATCIALALRAYRLAYRKFPAAGIAGR
jgi:hypothetical protein